MSLGTNQQREGCFGDWGLGIGAQSPIPNPQSPIPNPQISCFIQEKIYNIYFN